MTSQELYNELLKYRKSQPVDIINRKKIMAWEYFRNIVPTDNLKQNINKNFSLYYAPLKQIKGANMICWTMRNNLVEIYQDENFVLTNPQIASIQTTHEVLHGLSQMKNEKQYFFGHQHQGNDLKVYHGIDEATTQLFTEDIECYRLSEDEDYLYFIKNIMRVMKVVFGIDNLANQYLNNNNQFEVNFNKLTNGKFNDFVSMINDIYILSKNKYYSNIENNDVLNIKKQQILGFTKTLVEQSKQTNQQLIQLIITELQDENFLNMLDIETNNIDIINNIKIR